MKRFSLLLLCAVLLLSAVACVATPPKDTGNTTTTTTPYIEPSLVDVSLKNMLPRELLSQLLDAEMCEPMINENSTQLDSISQTGVGEKPVSLKINMMKRTRDHYDSMLDNYRWAETFVEVESVGDAAYWASDYTQPSPFCSLICYAEGYVIDINLTCEERADSTLQTQATQVALTMIAALAKK